MGSPSAFRTPRQLRSRKTLERIAAATETLLAERGPDNVTVQEIVNRADTSVGAFYGRFGNKDGAVAYVRERFWQETRALWAEFLDPGHWRGVSALAVCAESIRRYTRVMSSDRRGRAYLLEMLGPNEDEAREQLRALDLEISTAMGALMEEHAADLTHPRPAVAGAAGFRLVLAAVRDHVLFQPLAVEDRQSDLRALILSLTQMYAGFLGASGAPGGYSDLLRTCRAAPPTPWSRASRGTPKVQPEET